MLSGCLCTGFLLSDQTQPTLVLVGFLSVSSLWGKVSRKRLGNEGGGTVWCPLLSRLAESYSVHQQVPGWITQRLLGA